MSQERPNPGFKDDPEYLRQRDAHDKLAGRLKAIHKLQATALPLSEIVGSEEYENIQDMWAKTGKRLRWSVAFPIVETYEILGRPKASTVFREDSYRRLYRHASAKLRPLNDDERQQIADLEIMPQPAPNARIRIQKEQEQADLSQIDPSILRRISADLTDKALEGLTVEERMRARRRAAWLAEKFAKSSAKAGNLRCELCEFDPSNLASRRNVRPRSLLDVHHRNPLSLGERVTEITDLSLLCPTCHRLEHILMRRGETLFDASISPAPSVSTSR